MRYNDNEVKRYREKCKIKGIDFENESRKRAAVRKKLGAFGISFLALGIVLLIVSILLFILSQTSAAEIISASGVLIAAAGAALMLLSASDILNSL